MTRNPSSPLGELARLISWHRRKLAVLAAMSAAAIAITAISPDPPPTSSVVVADRQLAGGTRLVAADLEIRELPKSAVPTDAISDLDRLVGRTLVAPLSPGSVLTELSILGDRRVVADGHTLAPVRVADPAVVDLIRPGDRIDVLASAPESGGATQVVAEDVRVVTIPDADDASGGLAPSGDGRRTLLLVEVPEDQATTLADAAANSQLTVVLS